MSLTTENMNEKNDDLIVDAPELEVSSKAIDPVEEPKPKKSSRKVDAVKKDVVPKEISYAIRYMVHYELFSSDVHNLEGSIKVDYDNLSVSKATQLLKMFAERIITDSRKEDVLSMVPETDTIEEVRILTRVIAGATMEGFELAEFTGFFPILLAD